MKAEPTPRDKCGTRNGYQSHYTHGEKACEPCTVANTERVRKWSALNRENERERNKRNREKFKDAIASRKRKRRAIQKQVESEPYSDADILHVYGIECHVCKEGIDLKAPRRAGEDGWERGLHLDHVISLSKGGSDTVENVKPTHGICNLRKSNK